MKKLYFICILMVSIFLFVTLDGSATRPSDLIKFRSSPVEPLNLNNVDPSSARAIAGINEPLTAFVPWELPNLGHRASWRADVFQEKEEMTGVPVALVNFTEMVTDLPASVGNTTMINDTMVWF